MAACPRLLDTLVAAFLPVCGTAPLGEGGAEGPRGGGGRGVVLGERAIRGCPRKVSGTYGGNTASLAFKSRLVFPHWNTRDISRSRWPAKREQKYVTCVPVERARRDLNASDADDLYILPTQNQDSE